MRFIRVAFLSVLLDVNSKALTHCTCVKLFTQTSFVLTGCFEYLTEVLSAKTAAMKPSFNLCAVVHCVKTVSVFSFDKVITSYGWLNLSPSQFTTHLSSDR